MWSLVKIAGKSAVSFSFLSVSTSRGVFYVLLNVVVLWAQGYSWGEYRPSQEPSPVIGHICSPPAATLPLLLAASPKH